MTDSPRHYELSRIELVGVAQPYGTTYPHSPSLNLQTRHFLGLNSVKERQSLLTNISLHL